MVNVSDNFKSLCKANGRRLRCVISVGDFTYDDDDILSFEFDDVVHPEEMAFGTTCSNRFHFEMRAGDYIPLSAVVKPYIGFEDSNELCPLGVFYISRRYKRKSRYSVTCYDKMYQLDSEYKSKLNYPASSGAVFSELLESCSIESDYTPDDFDCEIFPEGATYRDVIGYICANKGGCAKFDRYGRLTVKMLEDCGESILRDNYISLSLKQDNVEVKKIKVINGEKIFTVGSGSLIKTFSLETPFGTQATASALHGRWAGFFYYGAEIQMQGLPYLESGDSVSLQNETDNSVLPIIISEIIYTYDGGLSAVLYSKSKNPVDDYETADSGKQEINNIYRQLAISYFNYENKSAVSLSSTPLNLAILDIKATAATCAFIHGQIVATAENDCVFSLKYTLNGNELSMAPLITLKANESQTVALYTFLPDVIEGINSFSVSGVLSQGNAVIQPKQLNLSAIGQYLKGSRTFLRPDFTITESLPFFCLSDFAMGTAYGAELEAVSESPASRGITESIPPVVLADFAVSCDFGAENMIPSGVKIVTANGSEIHIVFINPICCDNTTLLCNAFTVTVADISGATVSTPGSVLFNGNKELILTVDGMSENPLSITVSYNNTVYPSVSVLDGKTTDSFTLEAEIINS